MLKRKEVDGMTFPASPTKRPCHVDPLISALLPNTVEDMNTDINVPQLLDLTTAMDIESDVQPPLSHSNYPAVISSTCEFVTKATTSCNISELFHEANHPTNY